MLITLQVVAEVNKILLDPTVSPEVIIRIEYVSDELIAILDTGINA